MTTSELEQTLQQLRDLTAENEIVEFKEAKNGYDFTKLGKYFSALSNEANLKGIPHSWLVFEIENKHHSIVNSQFRSNREDLDSLKGEIANKTNNRITFIEIHELNLLEGRVVMFQIPAAPKGFPIAFSGHYYGRDGEELVPLNLDKKTTYSKSNAFDNKFYRDLIEKSIKERGSVNRNDVEVLLGSKFPDWMNEKQRKTKINNLLSELRKEERIRNVGIDFKPKWVLVQKT